MSSNCYELAYASATNEIAEINTQIQRLIHRRELLGRLLEPLRLVVPGISSDVFPPELTNGSDAASPQLSQVMVPVGVPELQSASIEAPAFMMESEADQTNGEANGHAIRQEDVAELAYRFWNERGQVHGHHEEDWARATAEVQGMAS